MSETKKKAPKVVPAPVDEVQPVLVEVKIIKAKLPLPEEVHLVFSWASDNNTLQLVAAHVEPQEAYLNDDSYVCVKATVNK